MHQTSYDHMARLAARFLTDRAPGTVIDIGSQDVNGSYRPIFEGLGWHYRGLDAAAGQNVDVVAADPYRYPIATNSVDLVVSGQAFEHVEFFWACWLEIVRLIRPGGLIFLIAPSRGPEHRYPVDCWRFYPDGYRALAAWGGIELIEVGTDWEPASVEGAEWGDTVGVFRKPAFGWLGRMRRTLLGLTLRQLMPRRRMPMPMPMPAAPSTSRDPAAA